MYPCVDRWTNKSTSHEGKGLTKYTAYNITLNQIIFAMQSAMRETEPGICYIHS